MSEYLLCSSFIPARAPNAQAAHLHNFTCTNPFINATYSISYMTHPLHRVTLHVSSMSVVDRMVGATTHELQHEPSSRAFPKPSTTLKPRSPTLLALGASRLSRETLPYLEEDDDDDDTQTIGSRQ